MQLGAPKLWKRPRILDAPRLLQLHKPSYDRSPEEGDATNLPNFEPGIEELFFALDPREDAEEEHERSRNPDDMEEAFIGASLNSAANFALSSLHLIAPQIVTPTKPNNMQNAKYPKAIPRRVSA